MATGCGAVGGHTAGYSRLFHTPSHGRLQSGFCPVVVTLSSPVTGVGRLRITAVTAVLVNVNVNNSLAISILCVVPCVFRGKEHLLVCGSAVDEEGVSAPVLFIGCLAAAVHGWMISTFAFAMFCFIRCDARHLLLSPCNTQ